MEIDKNALGDKPRQVELDELRLLEDEMVAAVTKESIQDTSMIITSGVHEVEPVRLMIDLESALYPMTTSSAPPP